MKTPIKKRPCKTCPFLRKAPAFLRRAEEIGEAVLDGAPFYCHNTTEFEEDPEGESHFTRTGKEQICAGSAALVYYETGNVETSAAIRFAIRFGDGSWNPNDFEAWAEDEGRDTVFDSLEGFVYHHSEEPKSKNEQH